MTSETPPTQRLHRTSPRLALLAACALAGALSGAERADAQGARGSAPAFYDLRPGATTRAELELAIGEPKRAVKPDQIYEYAPPAAAADADRLVVEFFSDTRQVARIDVYLKTPLAADALRQRFGNAALRRDRAGGGEEELFYPSLQALVYDSKAQPAPAMAIGFLSPRYLADVYGARASALQRARKFGEARDESEKAATVDPDYARGYVQLGEYFLSQNNADEAIVRLTAAANARYSPHWIANAHLVLITAYGVNKKLLKESEGELAKVLASNPTLEQRVDAHIRFGHALRANARDDIALQEFTKALDEGRGHPRAQLALADFHQSKGDFTRALPLWEALGRQLEGGVSSDEFIEERREHITFQRAYALGELARATEAIPLYEKVLAANPRNSGAWNNLGNGYRSVGNLPKAIESYEKGLQIADGELLLHRNYGRALLESGRLDDARRQSGRALAIKSNDATSMFDLAREWAAAGKKKEAMDWLAKAVDNGYRNRAELTADRFLERYRRDDEFKKQLARMP